MNQNNTLRNFAAKQILKFSDTTKFVGVLGSVGKTTTIRACISILSQQMDVLSTSQLTSKEPSLLAEIIFNNKPKFKKVFIEIDETEKNKDLLKQIKLQNLIITQTDSYNTGEESFLMDMVHRVPKNGVVILNGDDYHQKKLVEKMHTEPMLYGFDEKVCHVWASNMRISAHSTVFELNYGVERAEVTTALLGFHQIYSLLAAATFCINLGFSLLAVKKGVEKMQPLEHVCQPFSGVNNSTIIDDSGNGNVVAALEGLEVLNNLSAKKRIVLFGGLQVEDSQKEKAYEEIARKMYKDKIDHVLLISGDATMIGEELKKFGFLPDKIDDKLSNNQAINKLLKIISRGDVVYIKGASDLQLDEVVKRITKK